MLHLPQILDAEEIRQARALLDGAPWADGRASAGRQAAQVKNNEQLPPECEQARMLQALVVRALDRSPQFMAAALPKKLFPPRFNRYSEAASHYGRHVDNAVRFTDNGARRVRRRGPHRHLPQPVAHVGRHVSLHASVQAHVSAHMRNRLW